MLSIASAATAQDTLRLELPHIGLKAPDGNKNNIRYVDFDAYHTNTGVREASAIISLEQEISPSYVDASSLPSLWSQGWFVSVAGGASAFVGDPIGCSDFFGRAQPLLQASIGKWIIPSIGTRLQYQGFKLKDGSLARQTYNSVQLDLMLDLASLWDKSEEGPRATVIPFAGCGIIQNRESRQHPFSLHYGIIGSLRLSSHLSLDLELSSMNTFKDFDGNGRKDELGDQLFNASLGLTCTLGGSRYRQRRVVDAEPYMDQNRRLLQACCGLKEENAGLLSELAENDKVLQQYEKILQIKGWLAANIGSTASDQEGPEAGGSGQDSGLDGSVDTLRRRSSGRTARNLGYPYNNYSGLNSLRERLRGKGLSGFGWEDGRGTADERFPGEGWDEMDDDADATALSGTGMTGDSLQIASCEDRMNDPEMTGSGQGEYMRLLRSRKACLGAPVLFFFELNSTRLTEPSQMENLREIAELAMRYSLKVKIVGAADSATGSDDINRELSIKRAEYIASGLEQYGVSPNQIRKTAAGGIDLYHPSQANRNTRVELYL